MRKSHFLLIGFICLILVTLASAYYTANRNSSETVFAQIQMSSVVGVVWMQHQKGVHVKEVLLMVLLTAQKTERALERRV